MKPPKEQQTLLTAQIPLDELALADVKARALGISRSEFVRRALRAARIERVEVCVLDSQPLTVADYR